MHIYKETLDQEYKFVKIKTKIFTNKPELSSPQNNSFALFS